MGVKTTPKEKEIQHVEEEIMMTMIKERGKKYSF
jgi:hypothetical protein